MKYDIVCENHYHFEINNIEVNSDLYIFSFIQLLWGTQRYCDKINIFLSLPLGALYHYFPAPNPALALLARHVFLCHYIYVYQPKHSLLEVNQVNISLVVLVFAFRHRIGASRLVTEVGRKLDTGDWKLLNVLAANMPSLVLTEFLAELANQVQFRCENRGSILAGTILQWINTILTNPDR